MNNIPKIIHYCWFGRGPLPPLMEKCIQSWKEYLPDYKLMLWNEDNFDISSLPYVQEAYLQKKYAFVTDYVRFHALHLQGGIYLDTDVEVIRNLDCFLDHESFTGFELDSKVAPGLIFGSVKGNRFLSEVIDFYANTEFTFGKDRKLLTVVDVVTDILLSKGLILDGSLQNVEGVTVYPAEYFSPYSMETARLNVTENTYSIHHYAASWVSPKGKLKRTLYQFIASNRLLFKIHKFIKKKAK